MSDEQPSMKNDGAIPHSFKQAYFDVLKNKFVDVMLVSIFVFLFFIPLIVVDTFFNSYIGGVGQDLSQLTETEIRFREFYLRMLQSSIDIPLLMLGFLGLGSSMYVFKKFLYGEKVYLWSDLFKRGIRETFRSTLLCSFIIGVIMLLININVYGLIAYEFPNAYIVVSSVIEGLILIYAFFVLFFAAISDTIYPLKLGAMLKNSLIFAASLFFKNLLVFIPTFAWIVCYYLFTNIFFQAFSLMVFLFFGAGLFSSIWTTYCLSVFDKYINKKNGVTINERYY